jgi:hypothetical protein
MRGRKRILAAAAAVAAAIAGFAVAQTPAPLQPPASSAPAAPPAVPRAPPPAGPAPEEAPPAPSQVPTIIAPAPAPPVPETQMAPIPEAVARPEAPKPQEAAKPAPLPKRALFNAAVIQALDKVTTETLRFEVPLNQPVRYKGLIFTVHTCQVEPPGSRPAASAHVEVVSQPTASRGRAAAPSKTIYRGWMFADAPGLHPIEHPVYDAWLIACKTASPPVNAASR